jgi:hypothetical protein
MSAIQNVRPARPARICYFTTWADGLEPVDQYLSRLPQIDLRARVTNPADPALLAKARLDCDWYAENARCFSRLEHPEIEFLPALICGPRGILDYLKRPAERDETRWFIVMAHQPQALGAMAGKVFAALKAAGVSVLFYAFDEASRFMPCFREIAPFVDVLIHDEEPLDAAGMAALKPGCRSIHRSWVANFLPFAAPFNETPEPKILFLGSQLGLTEHRRRQIAFLQRRFKDRFVASYDHSISVADRLTLNRYKVGICPEGRKFATPAMGQSHTDRPFWSGCLGLVPVSENSKGGGRLDELAAADLILRYPHGDLEALAACCDRALELPNEKRRRIYEHFNRHETVGSVVAEAIGAFRGLENSK